MTDRSAPADPTDRSPSPEAVRFRAAACFTQPRRFRLLAADVGTTKSRSDGLLASLLLVRYLLLLAWHLLLLASCYWWCRTAGIGAAFVAHGQTLGGPARHVRNRDLPSDRWSCRSARRCGIREVSVGRSLCVGFHPCGRRGRACRGARVSWFSYVFFNVSPRRLR